ncbi:MAG: NADH dehydrogenase (quinone) subunit G [Gammaproteobacteria bacterium]|nr:MAG: NADH dehydrogenase (quinone) subunit G [Gammaproteobacteria bacterium]
MITNDNKINITINDKKICCNVGDKIIDVADDNGIEIPRFCYHKKLSTAASCRMCLVEIEGAPKLMPSCATQASDNMVVQTKSDKVVASQKAVMEFLLINHPLDCPICDQGGECSLQDNAFSYGKTDSIFKEDKLVNLSSDIGPLVATNFNRCIMCTRCVRFGEEISGHRELGGIGRANTIEISTYINKNVDSELSGNIIDLCPVGSLTSKPSQFQARAWEVIKKPAIMPFDCLGSNANLHIKNNKIIRVLPRENNDINEMWLSDRDRFGFLGQYSQDRLSNPIIKKDKSWHNTSWGDSLAKMAEKLKQAKSSNIGCLIGGNSSNEEIFLLSKIIRSFGCNNIDYRLLQKDFSDNTKQKNTNWLGLDLKQLEQCDSVIHVCSNLRKDVPMLNHRVFTAYKNGAKISSISNRLYDFNYPLVEQIGCKPSNTIFELKAILKEILKIKPQKIAINLDDIVSTKEHKNIALQLSTAQKSVVMLGIQAKLLPDYTAIKTLCDLISQASNSIFAIVPEYANSLGAKLYGAIPYYSDNLGKNSEQILKSNLDVLILYNFDSEYDINSDKIQKAASLAKFVIVINPYSSQIWQEYADLILPLATTFESSGSMVNCCNTLQKYQQNIKPYKYSQEGWRILLTLADKLSLDSFKYKSVPEIQNDLTDIQQKIILNNDTNNKDIKKIGIKNNVDDFEVINEFAIYQNHPMVRRSLALQKTNDAASYNKLIISLVDAKLLGIKRDEKISITTNNIDHTKIITSVQQSDSIPDSCIFLPNGAKYATINNNTTIRVKESI